MDVSDEDAVSFKQWTHSEKVHTNNMDGKLVEELTRQVEKLDNTPLHSQVTSGFLSLCKVSLTTDSTTVLFHFAENESFITQDAVEEHYCENTQATIHPCAVNHLKDDARVSASPVTTQNMIQLLYTR